MKTPAGDECSFYFEDFHRGRNRQECRLIPHASGARAWHPTDCAHCPVPGIQWANASRYLRLEARIKPGILGFGRKVQVEAFCSKHEIPIKDPHLGCEQCAAERPDITSFLVAEDDQ